MRRNNFLIVFFLSLRLTPRGVVATGCANDATVLSSLESKYTNSTLPVGGAVNVTVELWVQEISKINELRSEFELDIYMTEYWHDPDLVFNRMNPCKRNISLDARKWREKFWNPNTCFVNSKRARIHRSPFTNIFLMIYDDGMVWVNYRMKLTGPCEKDLKSFPIDRMKCYLTYESFNHNEDEVQLFWKVVEPILILRDIMLPDYKLMDYKAVALQRDYPPGRWRELTAIFTFRRLYGFYILQVYIPSYLSVFISWISFYLGPKAMPPRTMLGVNSLLALTFQFGSVVTNLPKTSDVKSIDVWIICCMAFIFATLLELALVGHLVKYNPMKTIECKCSWWCYKCPVLTANKIDRIATRIFPVMFIAFNVWYWGVFI